MSKNLVDVASNSPSLSQGNEGAATERRQPALRTAHPEPDANLDAAMDASPAPESLDADATMRVRLPFVRPPETVGPQRVPGYEILEELGRGGMGVVYKAWQHSLQRTVAVKMILAGSFAGADDLQRFRAEAMAIGRLHHPHLLNIFEIGESASLPFYAMEYMEGGSLSHRLNGEPIAPRVAAALLRSLAQAMDYAHKNGIVHRDLKPANILLSGDKNTPLEDCIAKVTDFGIAKYLHQDNSHTRTGDILGTPHYMAPEQAMGRTTLIGPAMDVYSLGAILYELLTGRPPFQGPNGADLLLLLAKEEPERPTHWKRTVPRDLETICMKCLEKDPARRYISAGALADDLGRFLNNEPVLAKPASLADRAVKWTRRRPALAGLLLMTGCLLLLGFGMMALVMQQAVERAQLKDDMLTQSNAMLADAYLERGNHLAEKGDVRRGMHWMVRSLEMTQEFAGKQRPIVNMDPALRRNAGKEKQLSDLAPIIRMNLACWGQCVSSRETSLPHTDWVWDLALSPDQQFVATASKDKLVQIWETRTGKAVGAPLKHRHAAWGVAFHPDGKTLFTVCGEYSDKALAGLLQVWSVDPMNPGHFLPRGEPVSFPYSLTRLHMHPRGDRVWVSSRDGKTSLYAFDPQAEGNGLSLLRTRTDEHHQLSAFSADGTLLAAIAGKSSENAPFFLPGEQVYLWDARTGEPRGDAFSHNGPIRAAIISKDNKHLIVGSSNQIKPDEAETSRLYAWNIAEHKQTAKTSVMPGRIKTATLAPNGQFFAVSVFEYTRGKDGKGPLQVTDGRVGLWHLHATGDIEPHGVPLRTAHVAWSVEFSPDSRMVLAGCENSAAFLWSVSNCLQLMHPVWHEGTCVKVLFSKDGRLAVTASAGGGVNVSARMWEVPTFAHIGPPLSQPSGIRSAFWEKDGSHAWIGCQHSIARWDPIRGMKTEEIPMTDLVYFYHATNDPRRFLTDLGDDRLAVFDRDALKFKKLPAPLNRGERGFGFDFHSDAQIFVQFWSKPSRIRILDRDGKPLTKVVDAPEQELLARCLSPRGDLLAVAQTIMLHTNRIIVYNTSDLSVRRVISVKHAIQSLAFTPDGKTIAFGGRDRQVQRYNIETGEFVGSPLLHEGIVHWVGYLANDRLLATSSEKGLILLWDVKTGKRIGPAFEHRADLMSICVHPQGKYLLTATPGKLAMTWRIPEPAQGSLEDIKLWVETMTGMEMDANDTIVPLDADRLMERRQRLAERHAQ